MQLRLQSISFTPGPRQLCWMQSLMIIFQRQQQLYRMTSRRRRPRCRWRRRRPPTWFCPAPFPPHPAQNAPRVPAPVQLYHQLYNPRPLLTSWTTLRQVWTLLYRQYRPDIELHYAKPLIWNLSNTHLFYTHLYMLSATIITFYSNHDPGIATFHDRFARANYLHARPHTCGV